MKNIELELEEVCYDYFIRAHNNFEIMKVYCKNCAMGADKFFHYVRSYIDKNISKPEFVKLLDILNTKETEKDIISFFENNNIDYKYLSNNLEAYLMYYRPDMYYLIDDIYTKLKAKIKVYENYLYRKLNPLKSDIVIDNAYAINVINEFSESPYTVNRFCYNKGLSTKVFKSYVQKTKSNDKKSYDNYLTSLTIKEEEKEKQIPNDVNNILNMIKQKEFSIIDFCLSTNYDVLELVAAADEMLSIDDLKLFRKIIKSFKPLETIKGQRLDQLLKTNFTFNINNELVTMTDDEKTNVINFLIENNIPICNNSFKDGCIKLHNNELVSKKMMF